MNRRALATATLFCITVALQGCAGAFEPLPPNTSFGTPPADIETPVRAHFEQTLKDPESARFRFGSPLKAHANWGILDGAKIRWVGYMVPIEVNAKNSYGGYTGYKQYMALFWGDYRGLYRVVEGSSHPTIFIH